MSNRSKEIAGINIGQPGSPRSEVVEAFLQKGAKLSAKSIPHLRAGRMSGNVLEKRVISGQMLTRGTPFKKDELYQRISHTATDPKLRLPNRRFPDRYSSNGFTARVATFLRMPLFVLDKVLKVMRTEAVMSAQKGLPPQLLEDFQVTIDEFLNAFSDPYTLRKSPTLQNLTHLRETGTIFSPDNFYRLIYQNPSGRFIGVWTTFEVDWLTRFYVHRLEIHAGLSSLDEVVLDKTRQGEQGFIPSQLTQQTGIPVDEWVVRTHTRALLGK